MEHNNKKYAAINGEKRKQLEIEWYESIIKDFRRERVEDAYYKYDVVLQNIKFITYMTDIELKISAGFAVDLLETLKDINNNGIDRQEYMGIIEEIENEHEENLFRVIGIWNRICTESMKKLLTEIDEVRRVGGAWALLIANPGLISAICAVYEQLVDRFEDEELYNWGGYFLLRAIMKMHSNEYKDKTE